MFYLTFTRNFSIIIMYLKGYEQSIFRRHNMSKLDRVKGQNTTLRYWMSVIVSLIVVCVGTVISDYRADRVDEVTLLAIITVVLGALLVGIVQTIINENTEKMEEL